MLDIHTHILPDMDDGAKSFEESMKILDICVAQGYTDIVFTPHFKSKHSDCKNNFKDFILGKFNAFKAQANRNDINLYPGCEIYYDKNVLPLLKEGKLLGINETKYILLEFPMYFSSSEMEDALYSINLLGYKVIIAHVERYAQWLDIEDIKEIKKEGHLIQINISSLQKKDGNKVYKLAKKVLNSGIVDYIATDTHSVEDQKINMGYIRKIIKKYPKINTFVEFLDRDNE